MTHNEREAMGYQFRARLEYAAAVWARERSLPSKARHYQQAAAYFALRAREIMQIESDEG